MNQCVSPPAGIKGCQHNQTTLCTADLLCCRCNSASTDAAITLAICRCLNKWSTSLSLHLFSISSFSLFDFSSHKSPPILLQESPRPLLHDKFAASRIYMSHHAYLHICQSRCWQRYNYQSRIIFRNWKQPRNRNSNE